MTIWSDIISHLSSGARQLTENGTVALLRSCLPLAGALLLGAILRRRDPRTRSWTYAMGLAATFVFLIVPLAPIRPSPGLLNISMPPAMRPVTVGDPTSTMASSTPSPSASIESPADSERLTDHLDRRRVAGYASTAAIIARPSPRAWAIAPQIYLAAALIWLAGVMLSLVCLIAGQVQVWLLCRRSAPCEDPHLLAALRAVCQDADTAPPALFVSGGTTGPFVTGVFRATIVIPSGLPASTDCSTLRAILAHEVHHIVSRDVAWMLVSRSLCVLFWPQPLLWALFRRWRESTEEACDRAALRQNCSPQEYARCLVALAEAFNAPDAQASAGIGIAHSRSALGRRIEQIMNHRTQEVHRMSPAYTRAMLGLFALLSIAACRMVTAQASDSEDSAKAKQEQADKARRSADRKRADEVVGRKRQQDLYQQDIEEARMALKRFSTGADNAPDVRKRTSEDVAALKARIAALEQQLQATKQARSADDESYAAKRAAEMDVLRSRRSADNAEKRSLAAEEKRRAELDYWRSRRDTDSLSEGKKLEAERRALELEYWRAARSADAAGNDKRAADEKRLAELEYDRIRHGADGREELARPEADKRAAEQDYVRRRREAAMAEDNAAPDIERIRSMQLDALITELARREAEMLELQTKFAADSPKIRESKAVADALRKKVEVLEASRRVSSRDQRGEAQRRAAKAGEAARVKDELAASQMRIDRESKALVWERSELRMEQMRQMAENRALKLQIAKLKEELELLRRQQSDKNGK